MYICSFIHLFIAISILDNLIIVSVLPGVSSATKEVTPVITPHEPKDWESEFKNARLLCEQSNTNRMQNISQIDVERLKTILSDLGWSKAKTQTFVDQFKCPVFVEYFFTCGLQFFYIYDAVGTIYNDMLRIFIMLYIQFDSGTAYSPFHVSIKDRILFLNQNIEHIPKEVWKYVHSARHINEIKSKDEILVYLTKFANIRVSQIVMFFSYLEADNVNYEVVWINYKKIVAIKKQPMY